jgi:4-hydroxysphinganine ceramide fatty acyl 2-hydroxylase
LIALCHIIPSVERIIMPGRTLPTILSADVQSRNTADSCYVTIGTKVYDITPFLEDHPGGGDLIVQYGGKDISEILKDELSHRHSEAAYEILDEHLIGFMATDPVIDVAVKSTNPSCILPLPVTGKGIEELKANGAANGVATGRVFETTGMSSAEDLSKETDATSDYRTHKFLDLNRPLLMQVWNGGFSKDFYLEQVHRPRHYKGGASAPLFGNFLEPLSKTPWWVIPIVWLPPVTYGTWIANQGLSGPLHTAAYWIFGLALWTLVEYVLHRGLFHIDGWVSGNRWKGISY